MIGLFVSEWERLWRRMWTWGSFLALPVLLAVAGRYFRGNNAAVSPGAAEYASVGNFAVLGLAEHLMTFFNLLVAVLLVLAVTEEMRNGQLRVVLQRAVTRAEVFWVKWAVVVATVFVFQVAYFIESQVVGLLMFERVQEIALFYRDGVASMGEAFSYSWRYYAWAFLTLVAVASVMMLVAVLAQTTTAAVGMGLGFLLASFGYPILAQVLAGGVQTKWQFLSVTHIQHQGIALMLAEKPALLLWNAGTMLGYVAVFLGLAYWSFVKREEWV